MSYEIYYYALLFVFGLFFGSFINLVSDRVVQGRKLVFDRSKCDYCGKTLGIFNLVPLFSFVFQRGKCASCGEKLSLFYPMSELMTGLSFVVAGIKSNFFVDFTLINALLFVYLAGALCFLITIFLTDAKYQLIPDKVVYTAILFVFFSLIAIYAVDLYTYRQNLLADPFGKYLYQSGFWNQALVGYLKNIIFLLASSFAISFFFFALILITKGRGMGGGDVKLGFLIGLFNGMPLNFVAIFLGFLLGAIYSVILVIFGKKTLKDTIAFGPFLILGSVISFLWGQELLNWYMAVLK